MRESIKEYSKLFGFEQLEREDYCLKKKKRDGKTTKRSVFLRGCRNQGLVCEDMKSEIPIN